MYVVFPYFFLIFFSFLKGQNKSKEFSALMQNEVIFFILFFHNVSCKVFMIQYTYFDLTLVAKSTLNTLIKHKSENIKYKITNKTKMVENQLYVE